MSVIQSPRPWRGETYYDRPQVKPAPFEPAVVGGYIFLAGLSGSSALIGLLARGRARDEVSAQIARRARLLSLLAPVLGAPLLIYDLHTPKRFYNMLRVAKSTSPMSIGTWVLMGFSAAAGIAGLSDLAAKIWPRARWPRRVADVAAVPAALTGAGLSTYTASLLSATSTPLWAAAPKATAMRFASSSMATGAAALAAGERDTRTREALADILRAALASEAVGTLAAEREYARCGIEAARRSRWSRIEQIGADGLGVALPLGLLAIAKLAPRHERNLTVAASLATIAGSALMRTAFLGAGMESARRPTISMRFAQPDNLPR